MRTGGFLLINRIETESKQEASMLINKHRTNGGLTEAKQIMLFCCVTTIARITYANG